MTENEPKILFGNLKGFPAICDNGKIDTGLFLEAAREIVTLIGKYFSAGFFFSRFWERFYTTHTSASTNPEVYGASKNARTPHH